MCTACLKGVCICQQVRSQQNSWLQEGLLSEAVAQSTASEPAEEHNSQPGLNFAKAAAAQLPDPGADEQGDARWA